MIPYRDCIVGVGAKAEQVARAGSALIDQVAELPGARPVASARRGRTREPRVAAATAAGSERALHVHLVARDPAERLRGCLPRELHLLSPEHGGLHAVRAVRAYKYT